MKATRLLNFILPIITVFAVLLLWTVAARAVGSEYILPSVWLTAEALVNVLGEGEFYAALGGTLIRSLISFGLSFSIAFVLALASEKLKYAERIIAPVVGIIRALPTVAVVLLLLFWTNSLIAPVIVTMLVVLPTSYTQLKSAFEAVDKSVVEAGRVDGAKESEVFFYLELPLIKSSALRAAGGGISLNFKLMVAAEVLAQTANSIGYILNTAKVYFEIARMLAVVTVAVFFGVVAEAFFNKLAKKARV